MIYDRALDGKLYTSDFRPSTRKQRILDVGCGTGIWTYDMANRNANLDVVGIDLVSEKVSVPPPNVRIMTPIDFNLPEWPFRPQEFDMIRNGSLNGSVPDWEQHLRKCF